MHKKPTLKQVGFLLNRFVTFSQ